MKRSDDMDSKIVKDKKKEAYLEDIPDIVKDMDIAARQNHLPGLKIQGKKVNDRLDRIDPNKKVTIIGSNNRRIRDYVVIPTHQTALELCVLGKEATHLKQTIINLLKFGADPNQELYRAFNVDYFSFTSRPRVSQLFMYVVIRALEQYERRYNKEHWQEIIDAFLQAGVDVTLTATATKGPMDAFTYLDLVLCEGPKAEGYYPYWDSNIPLNELANIGNVDPVKHPEHLIFLEAIYKHMMKNNEKSRNLANDFLQEMQKIPRGVINLILDYHFSVDDIRPYSRVLSHELLSKDPNNINGFMAYILNAHEMMKRNERDRFELEGTDQQAGQLLSDYEGQKASGKGKESDKAKEVKVDAEKVNPEQPKKP